MSERQQPSEQQELQRTIVRVALELCAERGWRRLRMKNIAEMVGISTEELKDIFAEKRDILEAFYDDLDQQSLAVGVDMDEETVRDRLFAMMMERLDCASPHREAVRKMLAEGMPKQALCRSKRWLGKVLKQAGASQGSPAAPLQQLALMAVWAMVMPVWLQDRSQDLSRTMAALDGHLGHAETAWQSVRDFLPKF